MAITVTFLFSFPRRTGDMVYLSRIYTKSGDTGQTSLGIGTRVPKTSPRIRAYGGTDELNAVIGIVLTTDLPPDIRDWLQSIQNDLFDLGADLCVPDPSPTAAAGAQESSTQPLRVTAAQTERLEGWIDAVNDRLEPLTSFILPGGTTAAAHLHHARTVCRRVEIGIFELAEVESVNPQVPVYLNRLSDLLFVLARLCNNTGAADVLWTPGEGQQTDPST